LPGCPRSWPFRKGILLFAAIVFPSFETVEIAILALADAAFGKPVATERMCG
jgi:hypothetical protein